MSENMRKERDQLIYQSREQGMTFSSIGKQLNITASRASIIYYKQRRILLSKPHWKKGMSRRLSNCLGWNEIESREQAVEAYQSGRLYPGKRIRNYGWKTHKELAKWLGLPEPQPGKPHLFCCNFCPYCHAKLM